MKTKKGQNQSVSIFQNIVRCIAEKLPSKTKPYFLSLMLGALLTVARRRTVTTWLQAALISDDFRQAFYHIPNVGRKNNELFDEMLKEILEKPGPVLATAAVICLVLDDSPKKKKQGRGRPKVYGERIDVNAKVELNRVWHNVKCSQYGQIAQKR